MDESTELWIVTVLSILTACGVGIIARGILNALFSRFQPGHSHRKASLALYETLNTVISAYMLIVGAYEKCILIGKGLVFEYYVTTLLLIIVFRYTLTSAMPNPLPTVMKYWEEYSPDEELHENGDIEADPSIARRSVKVDGLRRRIGETANESTSTQTEKVISKPHSRAWICLKHSAPSLLGLFLGLQVAVQWLHFAWDGYLTSHHLSRTGLLRDCIIVLQTGPIQGFIVEAFITFLLEYTGRKLSQLRFGSEAMSFFISSCILSSVITIALYTFIDITGSFANPLLAYALERECLYDITSTINHVIVYWVGALAGMIAFNVTPEEKHSKYLGVFFAAFVFMYFFTPGIVERNFLIF